MSSSNRKQLSVRRRAASRHPSKSSASEWKLRRASHLQVLEAPALAGLGWLRHGFSTRSGKESEPKAPASPLAAAENRRAFFASLGAQSMRVAALRQIHSDVIHRVDLPVPSDSKQRKQGDALITREPGVLLTIQTADCVPILLADTRHRAVAAIHAGWRGTANRIAEKTLGRMRMEFGTSPHNIVAALGPSIGRCCYEVGPDVAKEFVAQFPDSREWFDGPFDTLSSGDPRDADPNWLPWLTMKPPGHAPEPPRVHLDLIAANRAILAAAGVPEKNISASGYCTACRSDLFYSYRREHTTGRMTAAIGIL
jgi:polyphenol oxidase